MRIATAPVNWNNPDVPEYRAWLPYGQMMDEFVEAGYDATEWGPGMPEDPAELKEALDARGLDMVGAFVGLGFRDAAEEVEHAARSIHGPARLRVTEPARCLDCGHTFRERERLTAPSRCPTCRSEATTPPRFQIA